MVVAAVVHRADRPGRDHRARERMQRTTRTARAASERLKQHSALFQVPHQLVLAPVRKMTAQMQAPIGSTSRLSPMIGRMRSGLQGVDVVWVEASPPATSGITFQRYEAACLWPRWARKRWKILAPSLLWLSIPALRNASQICAMLRPSCAAMLSNPFLRSVGILNVNCASFFIGTRSRKPIR
jgi:hypothetical protein